MATEIKLVIVFDQPIYSEVKEQIFLCEIKIIIQKILTPRSEHSTRLPPIIDIHRFSCIGSCTQVWFIQYLPSPHLEPSCTIPWSLYPGILPDITLHSSCLSSTELWKQQFLLMKLEEIKSYVLIFFLLNLLKSFKFKFIAFQS